jgi:hypothetical protein
VTCLGEGGGLGETEKQGGGLGEGLGDAGGRVGRRRTGCRQRLGVASWRRGTQGPDERDEGFGVGSMARCILFFAHPSMSGSVIFFARSEPGRPTRLDPLLAPPMPQPVRP